MGNNSLPRLETTLLATATLIGFTSASAGGFSTRVQAVMLTVSLAFLLAAWIMETHHRLSDIQDSPEGSDILNGVSIGPLVSVAVTAAVCALWFSVHSVIYLVFDWGVHPSRVIGAIAMLMIAGAAVVGSIVGVFVGAFVQVKRRKQIQEHKREKGSEREKGPGAFLRE